MINVPMFDVEASAAEEAAGPRLITVTLPAGLDLINSNHRLHPKARARLTKKIRDAAHQAVAEDRNLMAAVKAAGDGPLFTRVHILGVLRPSSYGRRRDPANWYPSFKAAVDGIVDAGLLDDDDHTRVVGPDMRLGDKVKGGQIVLIVRALAAGEDPLGYEAVAR